MSLLSSLVDLVLPQRCAGCGAAPSLLCAACSDLLSRPARPCPPRPSPPGLPVPWAVAPYAGPVRAMIVAHKEHGRTGLTTPLGRALARSVLAGAAVAGTDVAVGAGAAPLVLVPIPSTRAAVRRRGHDPMLQIVEAAVAVLRRRGVAARCLRVLAQTRQVADQAGLSAWRRQANLDGALVAARPIAMQGARVVVVDDVVTTGATLAEATRALRAAGVEVLATATVAATQRSR